SAGSRDTWPRGRWVQGRGPRAAPCGSNRDTNIQAAHTMSVRSFAGGAVLGKAGSPASQSPAKEIRGGGGTVSLRDLHGRDLQAEAQSFRSSTTVRARIQLITSAGVWIPHAPQPGTHQRGLGASNLDPGYRAMPKNATIWAGSGGTRESGCSTK